MTSEEYKNAISEGLSNCTPLQIDRFKRMYFAAHGEITNDPHEMTNMLCSGYYKAALAVIKRTLDKKYND